MQLLSQRSNCQGTLSHCSSWYETTRKRDLSSHETTHKRDGSDRIGNISHTAHSERKRKGSHSLHLHHAACCCRDIWQQQEREAILCTYAPCCLLLLSWPVTAKRKNRWVTLCSSVWETLESVAKDKRQLLAKVLAVKMQVFASSFDVGGAFVDSFGNWVSSDCPNLSKHVIISDGKKVIFPLTNFFLPQNQ